MALKQIEKDRLYELLFETATEGLLVADERGNIVLANERLGEIFGYTKEELNQMNVDQLLPNALRNQHQHHRNNYLKNPHKRPMGRGMNLQGARKDGTLVPIEISLNYYKGSEGMVVLALIMDITQRVLQEEEIKALNKDLEKRVAQRTLELKESQQLYRLIARNFPNGTINVFDRALRYVFAEGQDLYKSGITSEHLVGKSYIEQLPKEVQAEMQANLERVFEGENLKFEQRHQDQHYLINAVGLWNDEGQINRILLVEQNITERIQAEQQTLIALEQQKDINELKTRFVSMASHEFRTPLSGILSSINLIEKYDELNEPAKRLKHYDRIKESVRHLTSILNDFLSLEKVEAGKIANRPKRVDVDQLMLKIIDQQQELCRHDQVIKYSFEGQAAFNIDPELLRHIAENLLSNALKYTPNGGQIEVQLRADHTELSLSVADTGIGIPEKDQPKLFDRFFRATNATNLEGTGLGLSIVKKYLDLIDGEISFESEVMRGTTFFVTIPNTRDEANTDH